MAGQKSWTLQDCILYANSHNLSLKAQELNLELQKINLAQSKANFLPSISANGSNSYNWGKTIDLYTNDFADTRVQSVNLYLQGSMVLFNGFQLLNTVKQNKFETLAQRYDLDYARDMKALEITTSFLQILYASENLKNKKEQVLLSKMQVERMQKLVDAGSLSKGDLLNINAQYASEQSYSIQAQNQLDLAYLSLKQMLDLPSDTAFEIIVPTLVIEQNSTDLLDPSRIYTYALENRPEIKGAEYRIESAVKGLAIAKGAISPIISLSGSLGTGYSENNILFENPTFSGYQPNGNFTSAGDTVVSPLFDYTKTTKDFSTQFDENQNYSLGLSVQIPIFNKMTTYNRIGQSKIRIQQAEIQLEEQKNNVRKTIEQAYYDARAAIQSYQTAQIQVQALEEAYTYADKKFKENMLNAYELMDAKTKLNLAKSQLINAKYEYVFRVKVLDYYYGKPLQL